MTRIYGKPALLASIISSLTAAAAAAASKEAGSTVVVLSLAGYLLLSLLESPWRLPFIASAVSAHAVNVALHYSNPLPLPLLILERSAGGASLNVDIVQIAVLAEASLAASLYQEGRVAGCLEERLEGEERGGVEEARPGEARGEAAADAPEGGESEAARQAPQGHRASPPGKNGS